jgi:hypothetical protein
MVVGSTGIPYVAVVFVSPEFLFIKVVERVCMGVGPGGVGGVEGCDGEVGLGTVWKEEVGLKVVC